jgi:hypothetical protein
MSLDWEPPTDHSPTARRMRFGCGGFVGILIGGRLAFEFTDFELTDFLIGAALGFVVVGFLSSRSGDEIWESLTGWLR